MTKPLKHRTIRSGLWVLIGHFFSQSLRLGSNLILTRLLVPEMFGVMAIVTIFIMGIGMFSDVGLQQNIVQSKRGNDKVYLNTAWTIQAIRGGGIFVFSLLLSVVMYFLGQYNSLGDNTVYADPQLPFLLALTSVTALISGFNSINLLLLNRKLIIGRVILIDTISQIIGIFFMVFLAWYYREIWSLVLGGIVASLIKMIVSHHKSLGERNYFVWDKTCAHEIFHFGKWVFFSSILGFMLAQGDRLLLGLWESPKSLGVYSIAFFLAMALKDALKKIASSVFYPMLSEVERENPDNLKNVYYRIRAKVDFFAMVTAGLMFSSGHVFIDILYDSRYLEAGWMFEILSLSMVFIGYSLAGMCLLAKGDAKNNMILTLAAVLFLYVSMPIAYYYYGLYGAIIAISFNYIIDIPGTFYVMNKYKLLDLRKEFRMIPVFFIAYFIGIYLQVLI